MDAPAFLVALVGKRQQVHCEQHPEPVLIGEWPAPKRGEWDPETTAAITKAAADHLRLAHADNGDAQP